MKIDSIPVEKTCKYPGCTNLFSPLNSRHAYCILHRYGKTIDIKNEKTCIFPGCSNKFIAVRSSYKYCGNHTKTQIRISRRGSLPPKPIKLNKMNSNSSLQFAKELKFEKDRLKAIAMSPNIDKLLLFTPDNGKTLIYCKDEQQIERAKERWYNLHSWKCSFPKK